MEDWIKYLQLSNGGDFLKGRLKNYFRINERFKLFLWDPKVGPTRPNTICTLSVSIVELDSLLYLEIWAHFRFFAFVSFALIFYELVVYLDEKILKSKKNVIKTFKKSIKDKNNPKYTDYLYYFLFIQKFCSLAQFFFIFWFIFSRCTNNLQKQTKNQQT